MVCYVVPMVAAILHYSLRKRVVSFKKNVHQLWLNLLFLGGAVFGVVDHIWNRQLFLVGERLFSDLMLGVLISLVIFVVWLGIVVVDKVKVNNTTTHKAKI